MPLSYEQVKTAVDNTKAPNFVPPVDAMEPRYATWLAHIASRRNAHD
jgi:hypothetical protein